MKISKAYQQLLNILSTPHSIENFANHDANLTLPLKFMHRSFGLCPKKAGCGAEFFEFFFCIDMLLKNYEFAFIKILYS